jgi:hypothetical protein
MHPAFLLSLRALQAVAVGSVAAESDWIQVLSQLRKLADIRALRVRSSLFFLEARVVGGDALRALKLVKPYPVSLVSRVCDQFSLCKFVECDQPSLTFGGAIVRRKKPPC